MATAPTGPTPKASPSTLVRKASAGRLRKQEFQGQNRADGQQPKRSLRHVLPHAATLPASRNGQHNPAMEQGKGPQHQAMVRQCPRSISGCTQTPPRGGNKPAKTSKATKTVANGHTSSNKWS